MEEKHIKDLTGNRGERIAEKKPSPEKTAARPAKNARRPFARPVVKNDLELNERISGKRTGSEPAETRTAEGESRRETTARRPFERRSDGGKTPSRGKNRSGGDASKGNAPARKRANPKDATSAEPENRPAEEVNTAKREERREPRRPAAENARGNDRRQKNTAQKSRPAKNERKNAGKEAAQAKSAAPSKPTGRQPVPNAPSASEPYPGEKVYRFTDEELRADGLLFTLDEPEPQPRPEKEPEEQIEVVGIRFRGAGKSYSFAPDGISFVSGEHAIVETVRGVEYGEVVQGNHLAPVSEIVQPLKPVLRKATAEDAEQNLANRRMEEAARPVFLEKVQKNKLDMQLVDIEYTFDHTKLCFYFTADGRVDFRELVKDLASVFRTRIELRQIGVRDEARMCGGLGICGRPFCCKSFLADFTQVSIKMAKEQNLALASAKISGSCGRLMCCLRYEQETYELENAKLPRPNSRVETSQGEAKVLESNFLTGQLKVFCIADSTVRYFRPEEVRLLQKELPEEEAEQPAEIGQKPSAAEESV